MAKSSSRAESRKKSPRASELLVAPSQNGHAERSVFAGDSAPGLELPSIERFEIDEAISAARDSKLEALNDIVATNPPHDPASLTRTIGSIPKGASPNDAALLRDAMGEAVEVAPARINPDTELSADWREEGYPYKNLLSRKSYGQQKSHLQVELLKLQAWVKAAKHKVVIIRGARRGGKRWDDQAVHGPSQSAGSPGGRARQAERR